jgi:hypothetical protein
MNRHCLPLLLVLFAPTLAPADVGSPLLLQRPTLSRTQVVFSYVGSDSGVQLQARERRSGIAKPLGLHTKTIE